VSEGKKGSAKGASRAYNWKFERPWGKCKRQAGNRMLGSRGGEKKKRGIKKKTRVEKKTDSCRRPKLTWPPLGVGKALQNDEIL